jgi:hypothetical protein
MRTTVVATLFVACAHPLPAAPSTLVVGVLPEAGPWHVERVASAEDGGTPTYLAPVLQLPARHGYPWYGEKRADWVPASPDEADVYRAMMAKLVLDMDAAPLREAHVYCLGHQVLEERTLVEGGKATTFRARFHDSIDPPLVLRIRQALPEAGPTVANLRDCQRVEGRLELKGEPAEAISFGEIHIEGDRALAMDWSSDNGVPLAAERTWRGWKSVPWKRREKPKR